MRNNISKMSLRRIIAVVMAVCVLLGVAPCDIHAAETGEHTPIANSELEVNLSEYTDGGVLPLVNVKMATDVLEQYKFRCCQGHGFAAERGNNLADRVKGKNVIVIGDNNVKHGADRLIINRDGTMTLIQDKYYCTGAQGIDACFENGEFVYMDSEMHPMIIEVPKDQYDDAVRQMAKKISENKVPGVTDPEEAKNLVRPGSLTYEQAKRLAKAGNLTSLKYDATNGIITAAGAMGISTVVNYAANRINGLDRSEAIKSAAVDGLKMSGLVFGSSVIAGQLAKTGAINIFKPQSEALCRALGDSFASKLLEATGKTVEKSAGTSVGARLTDAAAKVLRAQALTAAVEIVVFSIPDAVNMIRGRISREQFIKNASVSAVGILGGTGGYLLGSIAGSSIAPGVGTFVGGIVGAIGFGTGSGFLADMVADIFYEGDAELMYTIVEKEFSRLCGDFLVTQTEADHAAEKLGSSMDSDFYEDMFQSENREQFIDDILIPIFEEEVSHREPFEEPSEEEMRAELKEKLNGVVFIH